MEKKIIDITTEEAEEVGLYVSEDSTHFIITKTSKGQYLPQLTIYGQDYKIADKIENKTEEPMAPLMYSVYKKTGNQGKYDKAVKPRGKETRFDKWYITGSAAINLLVTLDKLELILESAKIKTMMYWIGKYQETLGKKLTDEIRQDRDEIIKEIGVKNKFKNILTEFNVSGPTSVELTHDEFLDKYLQDNGKIIKYPQGTTPPQSILDTTVPRPDLKTETHFFIELIEATQ